MAAAAQHHHRKAKRGQEEMRADVLFPVDVEAEGPFVGVDKPLSMAFLTILPSPDDIRAVITDGLPALRPTLDAQEVRDIADKTSARYGVAIEEGEFRHEIEHQVLSVIINYGGPPSLPPDSPNYAGSKEGALFWRRYPEQWQRATQTHGSMSPAQAAHYIVHHVGEIMRRVRRVVHPVFEECGVPITLKASLLARPSTFDATVLWLFLEQYAPKTPRPFGTRCLDFDSWAAGMRGMLATRVLNRVCQIGLSRDPNSHHTATGDVQHLADSYRYVRDMVRHHHTDNNRRSKGRQQ